MHYTLLLPQGFVEASTLKALASTGSNLGQVCCYQECSPHTLLPQCVCREHSVSQTTPWCALRSGCNQRNSTTQRRRGSLVSMSARCLNQISWSRSLRPLRRNLDLGNLVTATGKWEVQRDTMYHTALATFGKRSSKSHDWFEAKSTVMTPVIDAQRAALAENKRTPSERNLQILRIARSKAQQTARRCANEYWTELSENNQSAAITGNIRGMSNGIRKALEPTLNKTAPLRSSTEEIITDKGHQLERWVEHYFDIYSRENPQSLMLSNACQPWKN